MRVAPLSIVSLMFLASVSGCFGEDNEVIEEQGLFDTLCSEQGGSISNTTWYHFANATDATLNPEAGNLTDGNAPVCAIGTYYGMGFSTFEPTIGITSQDNLYMTSWGNGELGSTAIIRCSGLIGMTNLSDYVCEDVYSVLAPVPNSNDPYVYVDPWTDRIMKFDMHALAGMTVEWSDNEGESWFPLLPSVATGWSVQDHQTIASSPYPALFHSTTWVFCVNGNYPYPVCSTSNDGGATWGPEVPGAPTDCNSGGLTGHMVGSNNGNFYRGNPGCNGEGYSIYKSTNGGLTWSEHPLPTETTGTANTWNFEEAQVYPDEDDNVHAMWIGLDNMPYYSYSTDEGGSWSAPIMIAPPAGLNGTGFPAIAAGDSGMVAFAYIGDSGGDNWNGYIGMITDAFSDMPLITTVQVNEVGDPLDITEDCGYNRCGGFGDFIDILVDAHGRAWFGLSHNIVDQGIYGTISVGPSLRAGVTVQEMPIGGPSTL